MTVEVGGIWVDHETSVQVYDVNDRAVFFRYLHGTPAGLLDAIGTMSVVSFEQRYTEVDVFEAQNPKVKPGQEWWNRRNPARKARVLSVLSGVVTFEHLYKDATPEPDALFETRFVEDYTNAVSYPTAEEVQDWPLRAHFSVVAVDQESKPSVRFVGWELSPARLHPDEAVVSVPIDWSQATWEVEPL